MPSLQPPLRLITASDAVGQVIRDWTSQSLRPRTVPAPDVPGGTVFFRTGGARDRIVAAAVHSDNRLYPVIVFKNPVALWQCAREPLRDGPVERDDWSWLRRQIMLHNPRPRRSVTGDRGPGRS